MNKILTRFSKPSPADFLNGSISRNPIYVVLENIRSLHNVGSVFRTSDAVLIEKLFLCGITGYPPNQKIAKTALGAQSTVPWEYHAKACVPINQLKETGVQIIAVEHTTQSKCLWELPLEFPICFVFGYEIEGISEETLACCDHAVELPMLGFKGSLNVAVSCAVSLFHALREHKLKS